MASVVESVEGELEKLGGEAVGSALAATALVLARKLDDPRTSSTSASMCAKALIDVMREVRSLAPARKEHDDVTSLTARREQRRARLAAAADTARS